MEIIHVKDKTTFNHHIDELCNLYISIFREEPYCEYFEKESVISDFIDYFKKK